MEEINIPAALELATRASARGSELAELLVWQIARLTHPASELAEYYSASIDRLEKMGSHYVNVVLAYKYFNGSGCEKDVNTALKYGEECIKHGIAEGYGICANIKRTAIRSTEAISEAYALSKEGMNRADRYSKAQVADIEYKKHVPTAFGPAANVPDSEKETYKEGFKLHSENALCAYPHSEYMVGYCYLYGKGTEKNAQEAQRWLTLAAAHGNTDAALLLAGLYENGSDGFAKDIDKAILVLENYITSLKGTAKIYEDVAALYDKKSGGAVTAEAMKYYTLSAACGSHKATLALGYAHAKRDGGDYSPKKAYEYFASAWEMCTDPAAEAKLSYSVVRDRRLDTSSAFHYLLTETDKEGLDSNQIAFAENAVWQKTVDDVVAYKLYGNRDAAGDFYIQGDTLVSYLGSSRKVTVPDTVKRIHNGAFKDCFILDEVILPAGLLALGSSASGAKEVGVFEGCINLKSVTVPDSVTEIGTRAFFGAASLRNVYLGDNVNLIGAEIFGGCTSLVTEEHLGVKYLGNSGEYKFAIDAFCASGALVLHPNARYVAFITNGKPITAVTSIDLGNVRAIGADCLWMFECDEIVIPPMHLIPYHMLVDCAFKRITLSEGTHLIERAAIGICDDVKGAEIILPRSIEEIDDDAFCEGKRITIHCPDTFRMSKKMYANLRAVKIEKYSTQEPSVTDLSTSDTPVTDTAAVGQGSAAGGFTAPVFADGNSISKTTDYTDAPQEPTESAAITDDYSEEEDRRKNTAPESAFVVNGGVLTRYVGVGYSYIHIPASVREIADCVFMNSKEITEITFEGENLISIGDRAFYGCALLYSCTIPKSCKRIGKYAFFGCKYFYDLYVPKTAKCGWRAFGKCPKSRIIKYDPKKGIPTYN